MFSNRPYHHLDKPELEAARQHTDRVVELRSLHDALARIFRADRTCVNCANFTDATEVCALVKKRPPAKVIAHACEKWEDEIPF